MRQPILAIEHLSKSFGGLKAVNDLSFAVEEGSITCLIGGNGAGKTTVFNIISGNIVPDAGRILFRGQPIDGMPAYRVAQAGIARGFQELRLFNRLTTLDNIKVAVPAQRGEGVWSALLGGKRLAQDIRRVDERGQGLLDQMALASQQQAMAEQLSYGQQKLLGLGRLLATEKPMLMLDEPTAGLSPAMVDEFCERMLRLVETGHTILLIEHNVEIVMRISNRVIVMHEGSKIAEGTPDMVRADRSVMHVYLGIE